VNKNNEKSVKVVLATAGGLYMGVLSVKTYGGRANQFRLDIDDKVFNDKVNGVLQVPGTGKMLVSVQDKNKLYLLNENR
jgi:hypothetical protein